MHACMKSVILCSALALPLVLVGQEHRDDQNRAQTTQENRDDQNRGRTGENARHEWNSNEDGAYRRYLEEHHRKYHAYERANKKEQDDYWKWRESHPDENRR